MTTAMIAARERQLDWLLGEVLGGETPFAERPAMGRAHPTVRSRWLAAALVVLAAGTALGVALLHDKADDRAEARSAQEPQETIVWHEAHGPVGVATIPADVVNLRCFDFNDEACAQLARFTKLEYLDLSGTNVNAMGYSVPPRTTDAGVRSLAALTQLRWLCLARCHDMKGEGLQALEALPRLEHLDLTYSGVESPAIERLPNLVSLRSLVLSHCMNFHGRSLAEVAKIPGLRRLELRACTTLSAADVMHLSKLSELRFLDLRDCQGRFRGQTESRQANGEPDATDEPEPGDPGPGRKEPPRPPVQDGIGITDANVAALTKLPLETLLLGGSESLTDAIGETFASWPKLRALDLSNLPKTTGALLARVPGGLAKLAIDDNPQFTTADLLRLPPLPALEDFGLGGLVGLDDATLVWLLAGKRLRCLRAGGQRPTINSDGRLRVPNPGIGAAATTAIAAQHTLRSLELADVLWLDAKGAGKLAALPELAELDLRRSSVRADVLAALRASRSLRSLKLAWCRNLDLPGLQALAGASLQELDLYGTTLKPEDIREVVKAWPGCVITMPDAQRYRVPFTR